MESIPQGYGSENALVPKGQQMTSTAGPSPRKPLGQLHANALITPIKPHNNLKRAHHDFDESHIRKTPLDRSSVSILQQDKGFQYLKRRKLSPSPPPTFSTASHQSTMPSQRVTTESKEPTAPHSDSDDNSDQSRQSFHSFGSLINYDPSSQPPVHRTHRTTAPPPLGAVILSRADTLRLTLRMALYKVVTQQSHVSFPRLRVLRASKPGTDKQWMAGVTATPAGSFGPPLHQERESSGEDTVVAIEESDEEEDDAEEESDEDEEEEDVDG